MKRILTAVVAGTLTASTALASNVGVDLNINIGNPPRVVVPAPPPPAPQPMIIDEVEEPPEFIYPSQLGFYVAVGVPYDMFYMGGTYYLFRGNTWYRSAYYGGPWTITSYRRLPPVMRRHRFDRVRYYRDVEYRRYRDDHDRYRGRYFRPERVRREERDFRREERREDRREYRDERREERRDHGRHGRDD